MSHTNIPLACQEVYSLSVSCGEGKNTAQARKVRRGYSLKQPAFLFLVNILHCKCISSTEIHLQYSFILNKIRCDLLQLRFLIHIITVWIYLYCTCKLIFINIFFKRCTALCHIILGVLMKRNNMLTWMTTWYNQNTRPARKGDSEDKVNNSPNLLTVKHCVQ